VVAGKVGCRVVRGDQRLRLHQQLAQPLGVGWWPGDFQVRQLARIQPGCTGDLAAWIRGRAGGRPAVACHGAARVGAKVVGGEVLRQENDFREMHARRSRPHHPHPPHRLAATVKAVVSDVGIVREDCRALGRHGGQYRMSGCLSGQSI
jgi:hypothetical protein